MEPVGRRTGRLDNPDGADEVAWMFGLPALLAGADIEGRDVRGVAARGGGGPIEVLELTDGRVFDVTADGRGVLLADDLFERGVEVAFVGDLVGDYRATIVSSIVCGTWAARWTIPLSTSAGRRFSGPPSDSQHRHYVSWYSQTT